MSFLDNEEEAKKYCEYRRNIEPKAYSESKIRYGNKVNQWKSQADENNEIEQFNEVVDDSKQMIREQIASKMREMANITFDLTDSEIEDFQSIIDSNSDDDDDFDDTDIFFPAQECASVHETGRDSISGSGESNQIRVALASCSVTSTLVEPIEQHTTNVLKNNDVPSSIENSQINDDSFAFVPENAKMPKAFDSKIDPDTLEKGHQILNDRAIKGERSVGINECEKVDSHQIDPNEHINNVNFNTNAGILSSELTFVINNIKDHIPPKYQCVYDEVINFIIDFDYYIYVNIYYY